MSPPAAGAVRNRPCLSSTYLPDYKPQPRHFVKTGSGQAPEKSPEVRMFFRHRARRVRGQRSARGDGSCSCRYQTAPMIIQYHVLSHPTPSICPCTWNHSCLCQSIYPSEQVGNDTWYPVPTGPDPTPSSSCYPGGGGCEWSDPAAALAHFGSTTPTYSGEY